VDFAEHVEGSNTIKGLPTFDLRRMVDASQTIEILKPLPLVSGPGWKLKKRLASIPENSAYRLCISCGPVCRITTWTETGLIIESEFLLVDSEDKPYARLFVCTSFTPLCTQLTHQHPLLVHVFQSSGKDHREALRAQRRFPTAARVHPAGPCAGLGRARQDIARADPNISSFGRLQPAPHRCAGPLPLPFKSFPFVSLMRACRPAHGLGGWFWGRHPARPVDV
jgi:hypothetical protein